MELNMKENINLAGPTIDDVQRRESALATLLEQMDVPAFRRNTSQGSNVRWLNRNLGIRNSKNPMFAVTMNLIKWLLKHHAREDNA